MQRAHDRSLIAFLAAFPLQFVGLRKAVVHIDCARPKYSVVHGVASLLRSSEIVICKKQHSSSLDDVEYFLKGPECLEAGEQISSVGLVGYVSHEECTTRSLLRNTGIHRQAL